MKMPDTITVSHETYKVLHQFPVLYKGWESDNVAWIVQDEGKNALVMSNHGVNYFAKKEELFEKITEYKEALSDSEKAYIMLL